MEAIAQFEKQILTYERTHATVPKGSHVLVACSGGPDSMALLHWLVTTKGASTAFGLHLGVACVDHSLRPESKAELAMVKGYAAQYGLPFYELTFDALALAKAQKQSIETVSRQKRYAFLRNIARQHGYAFIATAHHQDDQGETVLLHLLRGAGTKGLQGMQVIDKDLWRPFLGVTKKDILAYLEAVGLTYATDMTNEEPLYVRNRIRLELLPLLKTYNPNIVATLARLGDNMVADERYLQRATEEAWQSVCLAFDETVPTITLRRQGVADLSEALFYRLWQRIADIFHGADTFSQAQLKALQAVVQGKKPKQFIGSQMKVVAQYDIIQVGRLNVTPPRQLPKVTAYRLVGLRQVTWLGPTAGPPPLQAGETVLIPQSLATKGPSIRHRQAGDRITLRHKDGRIWGHRKLKDWLIDRKIPQGERDSLWFLCGDSVVFALANPKAVTIVWEEQATAYWACSIEEDD